MQLCTPCLLAHGQTSAEHTSSGHTEVMHKAVVGMLMQHHAGSTVLHSTGIAACDSTARQHVLLRDRTLPRQLQAAPHRSWIHTCLH
jgi:hypothetical protein